jgi:hypothetical protein
MRWMEMEMEMGVSFLLAWPSRLTQDLPFSLSLSLFSAASPSSFFLVPFFLPPSLSLLGRGREGGKGDLLGVGGALRLGEGLDPLLHLLEQIRGLEAIDLDGHLRKEKKRDRVAWSAREEQEGGDAEPGRRKKRSSERVGGRKRGSFLKNVFSPSAL